MLRLYNTALWPLRLLAPLWAATAAFDARRRERWAERLARRTPGALPGAIWIHGSSVGEARIVGALAGELRGRPACPPVAVSSFTDTGRERLPAPPDVDARFLMPLDFPGRPSRILKALRPGLLALVETELWPNLLTECRALRVPVAVVNGRLSARGMSRYRRWSGLYRPLLEGLARVGAQSSEDAGRFVELGLPAAAVEVTGNAKYDLPPPALGDAELRRRLGVAAERPVFVAGSTGDGEEVHVLRAFVDARRARSELLLVLAPRHLRRLPEVEQLMARSGLSFLRLSEAGKAPLPPSTSVLLVDTLGELASLYVLGLAAFVGGSLVPVGGHNLLEPAAAGVPVLFGPFTDNAAEPAAALERSGGGARVADAAALGRALRDLLSDESRRREMGRRAAEVVAANRGALQRSADLLLDISSAARGRR